MQKRLPGSKGAHPGVPEGETEAKGKQRRGKKRRRAWCKKKKGRSEQAGQRAANDLHVGGARGNQKSKGAGGMREVRPEKRKKKSKKKGIGKSATADPRMSKKRVGKSTLE